jgi:predicted ester cyclase
MRRAWMAVLLLTFLGACGGGDGALEKNKAIARSYLTEVLLEGRADQWDRYFLDAVVFNGREIGQAEMLQSRAVLLQAFPDFRLIIEDQIAEADKVLTRVTFTGTHTGNFLGIQPTGERVVYRGLAMDRIIDGKVVEMWHEADTWGMLQQMGVR